MDEFIDSLGDAVIFTTLDYNNGCCFDTDASDVQLCCCLKQDQPDGKTLPYLIGIET
jgi:hypothetical protein